ncbi:TonB-dependent receptor [Parasegetibacter sp. NRK P23]|uniref:SusC/RagA family TonB-linked outer membrane protein n=1 Tax=Parasegetibacter sp. NRK P23 TaxID=2942999 RepID=UPI002043F105|nr:TonB-dependent receptor [Parasegetibacter sp. NRK P23]MCM5527908.1 TonB-dependent receptor [Parasegetibacter sp. NRK P23]
MKKLFLLLTICLGALATYAQQTVSGTVKNAAGPVEGASVFEKDVPNNGTVTDAAGNFSLTLRGKGTLVVQSIGYLSKELNVSGRNNVQITLEIDAKGLEDVVVIGYGKTTKVANTAAVSSISGDEIRQTPTASFQNALVGRVPGIVSQQRSGRPGGDGSRILIRGLSSMGSGDNAGAPLIILDDLEYQGNLSDIDADQIENFTILKDAASTAVFGIKGANGVIVITTRRGKTGRARVTFRSENAAQQPTYLPKYLDSYNVALIRNRALESDGLPPFYTEQDLEHFKNGTAPYTHPNIDWADLLLRDFSVQSYNNMNISGGTEKAKYFVSAGYLWQNGMIKDFTTDKDLNSNYYYKRYNFRSNLDFTATKTLTLNMDLSGTFSERNEPNIGGRNNRNNIFFEISDYNQLPPFAYNPYNPDGSYGSNPAVGNYSNNVIGRIALGGYNRSYDNNITVNARAIQKLDMVTKGLSARFVTGYNAQFRFWRSLTRTEFPSFGYDPATETYAAWNPNIYRVEKLNLGYYADGPNSLKILNLQGALNYDRNFGGQRVYALALFNQTSRIAGTALPYYLRGYSFRAGYDYEKKYLLELNAGYNGSSRFSEQKRYSWFPAVSVGWNVAEEGFFKNNISFVDLFKIRGSIGVTGTDELAISGAQSVYLPRYINSGSYSIGEISNNIGGIVEDILGNDVTWEKERQWNIGVDLKMFQGKLGITADYFDKYRYDILIQRNSVSTLLGVNLPPVNLGEVQNRGFEIELSYADQINNNLQYSIRTNISVAKNKVLYMDEAQPAFPWLNRTGNPLGTIPGYTFIGFYQDADDIAKSPVFSGPVAKPGDLKYADLNGDNIIDVNDQRILKYPNLPNTILGFTGNIGYKSLSFSFTMQSALNFANRKVAESINPFSNNLREIHAQAWTPENSANPAFPRISTVGTISNATAYPSDYWFRRTDYLRVKTMQLSYDLPKKLMNKLTLQGTRIYVSGYNLLTWMLKEKNIYEVDPETPSGTEGGDYPVQKVINLGLQITF